MEKELSIEEWKQYLGITKEDTVDEDDMEGEWEDVRKLRTDDGGTQTTGEPNH